MLLAAEGRRVAVVDTDIQSPGIHVLFGLDQATLNRTLNDYLWSRCRIQEAAHDVTPSLGVDFAGRTFLVPSSIQPADIAQVMRRSEEHTSELQSRQYLVCRLLLEKKK